MTMIKTRKSKHSLKGLPKDSQDIIRKPKRLVVQGLQSQLINEREVN